MNTDTPPATVEPTAGIQVDFDNLRRGIANQFNNIVQTLNESEREYGRLQVDSNEINYPVQRLFGLIGTLLSCYEEGKFEAIEKELTEPTFDDDDDE